MAETKVPRAAEFRALHRNIMKDLTLESTTADPVLEYDWIATAWVPGGVEIRLMRRDDEFTVVLERTVLMSTRVSASEEALGTLTAARLSDRRDQQWLIGGYGMGFTLRAALATLSLDASIVVAEIVPEIIAWARGPMRAVTAGCLDDPRVMLVEDDVAMLIEAAHNVYDAILLDVDNGPEGLTRLSNDDLYDEQGLQAAYGALRNGGVLAIWSVASDADFTERLRSTGFDVEEVVVREDVNEQGAHQVIWFARKPVSA